MSHGHEEGVFSGSMVIGFGYGFEYLLELISNNGIFVFYIHPCYKRIVLLV